MKFLKSSLLTLILALPAIIGKAQQSAIIIQNHNNQVPYNTAYSLLDKAGSINLNGRRQWVGVEGAPSTFQLNASLPIEGVGGAGGLSVSYDKFNIEKLTEASAFFAKGIRLSEHNYLGTSINVGIRNYVVSYTELDPNDISFNTDIKETYGTVGLGLMFYDPDKYYLGVSLPRLSMRSLGKNSVDQQRNYSNTYYFSGAYLFSLSADIKLKPATMVSYSRNLPSQADFSSTVYLKNKFGIGVNYRTTSEISGMLSAAFSDNVRFGYSYQTGFGSNNLSPMSSGTHEIFVGFRFGKAGVLPKLL